MGSLVCFPPKGGVAGLMYDFYVTVYLFAIVCDWGQDGTQCFETHGDVEQMGSKEEVVVVTQDGHGHIPGQIQEGLQGARGRERLVYHFMKCVMKWLYLIPELRINWTITYDKWN